MKAFDIKEEIMKLKSNESKVYYYLYEEAGFELGFGKGGKYPGHSHLFFCDILYSPKPISTFNADGTKLNGNLIVIPPKTYLGDVTIDNFFFIKFCPTNELVTIPDKIDSIENEDSIKCFSNKAKIEFSWYKKSISEKSFFILDYKNNELTINLGESNSFLIF